MYDLIIIGSGPAGISAGIYSAIYKLNALIIGEKSGGYAADAYKIINYPGMSEISGLELMQKFAKHLQKFNVPTKTEVVNKISKLKNGFKIITDKLSYQSKTVILATGSERRRLHIPGENELTGKGVAYCATCDAFFFKDKITAVIGGADSALTSALHLAETAKKVYLIYRKENPTALPAWIEKVKNNPKIELIAKTNIKKIIGENKVEAIELDKSYQNKNILPLDGVFIEIGSVPLTNIVGSLGVNIDNEGFVKVKENQETNISGFFAAGDVTTGSNKLEQIITASAEGAVAANSVFKNIK